MVPQDIQTNGTVGVDVGVIYLGRKTNLGRFERVIGGEGDREEKNAACIRGVTLTNRGITVSHLKTPKGEGEENSRVP